MERVQVSEKVWALVVSSVGRALVSGEKEWALAALSVERVQISGEMG